MNKKPPKLCIHGHFYQPPRENPWMEEIEVQESAAPFHDWNERIYSECYKPNTRARVLDSEGKITSIANNFESISFNIGPTLMSWLEMKHPVIYNQIIEADKKSIVVHNGHGNAIAQVYNHMIMPLANKRDKMTQVLWGIEDFKYRFKRTPEAIWLPETACNDETLEVLIEAGMKYVLLEPHQAEAVRSLSGDQEDDWTDVSSGEIDPKEGYRYLSKSTEAKFIDIFFYDGPISKDIGFGDLLAHAENFMSRIEGAKVEASENQLIHVATDGETYGHHKPFGDRVLAYVIQHEALKRGFEIVNYAQYLEHNSPKNEVRIKSGENGEGTSWSCSHGVKRWKEHCGCRGDGPEEWNQEWRKPLREALDWLRDELCLIFEKKGRALFEDPWKARNDYIRVILKRSKKSSHEFVNVHQKAPLSEAEATQALKLLEIQRHAMLMYTSCGWFFTELSGIETVQILAYAARAIELACEIEGESLEKDFLERLAKAKSNVKELKNGKHIYKELVKSRSISWGQIANYYAIMSTLNDESSEEESQALFCYDLHVEHQRKENFGTNVMNYIRIKLRSKITQEEKEFACVAVQLGPYDFRCSVVPYEVLHNAEAVEEELFRDLHTLHFVEIMRRIDTMFGKKYYALKDLPIEQRLSIVSALTQEVLGKISSVQESIYDESRRMNEIYRSMNLDIPKEVKVASEQALERKFNRTVIDISESSFDSKKHALADRLLEEARTFGIKIPTEKTEIFLSQELEFRVRQLPNELEMGIVPEILDLLKFSKRVGICLDMRNSQDAIFYYISQWEKDPSQIPNHILKANASFSSVLRLLGMNEELFLVLVEKE